MENLVNLLFTFWTVTCFCAGRETSGKVLHKLVPLISNGFTAYKAQFPYQANIYYYDEFRCGGSVIHKRWVLTAAHCAHPKDLKDAYVKVGTNNEIDGQKISIEKFIRHEYGKTVYVGSTIWLDNSNDIALIRLSNDIEMSDFVRPIRLAKDDTNKYENVTATVSGLGYTGNKEPNLPEVLQYLQVEVISDAACEQAWAKLETICRHCICTSVINNSSFCKGDSGGPLVFEDKQIGIVSFGDNKPFCADSMPNVYTRVSYFIPWISQQLELYSDTLL